MTKPEKTIVFDLDGTLVDSARDLVPMLNRTVAADGIPPISIEQAGYCVGQGAMKMIERAYALHGQPLDPERHKELLADFLAHYEENLSENTVFYEGALGALDRLAEDGWVFAVCTNKYEHLAHKMLDELGQSTRFSAVSGGDTFDFRKPDPAHIIETVKLAGGVPETAIVVGDSINDIAAAREADIPVIAVDFGYSDVPVAQLEPTAIISHFRELFDTVEAIASNRDRKLPDQ